MHRPVFDHLWRQESYQPPLSSARMSDLKTFRETRKEGTLYLTNNSKTQFITFAYVYLLFAACWHFCLQLCWNYWGTVSKLLGIRFETFV